MLDFGETYEEELPRVYGYVAYQVASQEEAEDLTQQTFERALAHWGEFDDRRATITTWLLAIARYKALSALRRRPDEELDEEAAAAIEDPGDDPEVAVQKKDKGEILRKCLAALSPEHRERLPHDVGAQSARRAARFFRRRGRRSRGQMMSHPRGNPGHPTSLTR